MHYANVLLIRRGWVIIKPNYSILTLLQYRIKDWFLFIVIGKAENSETLPAIIHARSTFRDSFELCLGD